MILESKPGPMMALQLGGLLLGLILMHATRGFTWADHNALAGFLLGCLITGLCSLALIICESRRVIIGEQDDQVVLEISRRFGHRKRIVIPYGDIRHIGLNGQGSTCDGSRFYDLVLTLSNGKEVALFGGCIFEGRMDREIMENLRERFQQAILAKTPHET